MKQAKYLILLALLTASLSGFAQKEYQFSVDLTLVRLSLAGSAANSNAVSSIEKSKPILRPWLGSGEAVSCVHWALLFLESWKIHSC